MLRSLDELFKYAINIPPQRLVVVKAEDDAVIESVNEAMNMGIISPILIGNYDKIIKLLKENNFDRSKYSIINIDDPILGTQKAIELIKNNEADILMKGLIETKTILKAVVNSDKGIKESKILSHVSLLSFPNIDRVLFATDCAMNINPSVEEKLHIIDNAVKLLKTLGYDIPKVGLVSAVENVNPKMTSTVEASKIVEKYREMKTKDLIVDGPFAIDNLVSKEAALHKGIESEVAGSADILVFPYIEAGNVFYKTSVFLSNASSAGIVIGATNPIVLTSRADSSKSKLYSIILSMVYNYGKNNTCN